MNTDRDSNTPTTGTVENGHSEPGHDMTPPARPRGRGNGRTAVILSGVIAGMVALSFASVPLYNLFCRVTGFGGTTQVSDGGPTETVDRTITVRFDANQARDMPWRFRSEQVSIDVKVGETGLAYYWAKNPTEAPVMGRAVYNVSPPKAGKYFHKVQCFCFTDKVLPAGETMNMPVSFYIDPSMMEDRNMSDVETITLSYTMYRKDTENLDRAIEEHYEYQERVQEMSSAAGRQGGEAGAVQPGRTDGPGRSDS